MLYHVATKTNRHKCLNDGRANSFKTFYFTTKIKENGTIHADYTIDESDREKFHLYKVQARQ